MTDVLRTRFYDRIRPIYLQCSSREADQLRVNFKSIKNNLQGKITFLYITNLNEHAYVVYSSKYPFHESYQGILLKYTFEFACHFVGNRTRKVSDFIINMATINSKFSNVMLKVAVISLQKQLMWYM